MKYLKYFPTEAEYNAFIQSEDFILPNVSYAVDADSVFYNIVKTESGDYKIYLLEKKDISGLTYNMIDLGLPSGLLWADRNIGAEAPEDFGTMFAWGETEGYNASIKYCTAAELCSYMQLIVGNEMELTPDNIDEILFEGWGITDKDMTSIGQGLGTDKCFSSDWSDYFDTTDSGETFNKYNTDGGLTVLQPEDDAATVNMGSDYRMPTKIEFEELINNCTVTFIDLQGNEFSKEEVQSGATLVYNLKGIKFTSSNGNSIFISASGYCFDSILEGVSCTGYLWFSNLYKYAWGAYHFYLNCDGDFYVGSMYRHFGQPARGVKVR